MLTEIVFTAFPWWFYSVVLPVATYQRLILPSKIDAKTDESAIVTAFSDPSVCKQRGHSAAAERNAILAPQVQEVAAAGVK